MTVVLAVVVGLRLGIFSHFVVFCCLKCGEDVWF